MAATSDGNLTLTSTKSVTFSTPTIHARDASVSGNLIVGALATVGALRVNAAGKTSDSNEGGEITFAPAPKGGKAWHADVYSNDQFRLHTDGKVAFSVDASGSMQTGDITATGLKLSGSSSPTLGAYAANSGIISTALMNGPPPPSPPKSYQILNVRENGHWGGFGALLTLFDHYFTPGRKQYWYSSRGQGALSEVSGSALGSCDCELRRSSNGRIHDPSGTTNDLYEDRVYVDVPPYHYCSVRIEWTALSTTFHPDPSATQSATGRSVKLMNGPATW